MSEGLIEKSGGNPLANLERQFLRKFDLLNSKLLKMEAQLSKVYDSMTIDYEQQEKLNNIAKQSVIERLGGKNTPAYDELSKKAFSAIWKDYKTAFHVTTYKNTLVRDFEVAIDFLERWKPKRELELMILGANSNIKG